MSRMSAPEQIADAELDVRLDGLSGEFVNQYWRERKAVVTRAFVAIPIGVSAIPIAGQTADVALQPALVPIKLHTQAISLGRLPGLPDRKLDTRRLRKRGLPQ